MILHMQQYKGSRNLDRRYRIKDLKCPSLKDPIELFMVYNLHYYSIKSFLVQMRQLVAAAKKNVIKFLQLRVAF